MICHNRHDWTINCELYRGPWDLRRNSYEHFLPFFFVCDWNFTSELHKTSTIICTNHFPECTIQNSFSFEHLSISYVQQKKDDVRIKEYFFKIRKTATVFKRERMYLLEQRFLKIQIYFSKACITNFSFLKWYYESFQFFKSW